MRLGLFMMPVHPPGRSLSDTLAEDTTKSILADRLGYDEVWMGEHFSATTEPFASPLRAADELVFPAPPSGRPPPPISLDVRT